MGTLYYGEKLDILRRYFKDETVDFVYLNPRAFPSFASSVNPPRAACYLGAGWGCQRPRTR